MATMAPVDLGSMHPAAQGQLALVVLKLSVKKVWIFERKSPPYHLSRLVDLQ